MKIFAWKYPATLRADSELSQHRLLLGKHSTLLLENKRERLGRKNADISCLSAEKTSFYVTITKQDILNVQQMMNIVWSIVKSFFKLFA